MMGWIVYYWVTYLASLYWILSVPSKLKPGDNIFGSAVVALFGFFFWPIFLAAFIKTRGGK